MINKVAEENKPELNGPLKELLDVVYEEAGEDCLSYLKQKAKVLLNDWALYFICFLIPFLPY